jgi:MobA/MobL family.
MLTMRPIEQDGSWGAKSKKEYILDEYGEKIKLKSGEEKSRKINTVDWNDQTKAEDWRQGWAEICNRVLEQNNHTERIDHRSYERQGIEQIPTIHLGVAASAMEKRGIRTERGNINREIEISNQRLRQLKARIIKLQKWLKEESQNTAQPTLADYIGEILSRKAQEGKTSRSQSLYNLKDASNMLNFLTANKIMDMAGLDEKFKSMIGEQFDIRDKLNPIDRRLKTLDEHIKYSGNYKAYRGKKVQYDKLYAQYKTIKKEKGFGAERKAQKTLSTANEYYENNRPQITLYESAEQYLKGVLQERFDPKKQPPVAKWTAEHDKLTAERNGLNQQYTVLKDEVQKAEQIRKTVYSILRQEQQNEQTVVKNRGMEL